MKRTHTQLSRKIKKYAPFYILMFPGLLYLFCNNYLPMLGLVMPFKKVNLMEGIFGGEWVGLRNFSFLVNSPDFLLMIRNTVGYNLVFLIGGPVVGIFIAFFFHEIAGRRSLKVYQTIILLPALISIQIVSYMVFAFLNGDNGMLNKIVLPFFGRAPIQWYSQEQYWPFILIFVYFWMKAGFNGVIYFASMLSISSEYYEAAQLDGASKWKQFTSITLPLIKPTVITLTIIGLGSLFKSDFGLFYQVPMNSGPLYNVTQTIDTYVFRGMTGTGNLALSAAAGFLQSVIGAITVFAANLIIRRVSPEDAMF